ncbi:BQ5605_C005g03432 [Microbotryum silenes-dioicae]|uniref:BQ5605_C005g03432 protein n=1 Tax=Microbotryum silenes-dioicae TaxID=796604 RepID=A0A2X0MAU0_9BASI|nr:BQ5605_C005g03432 [Microbotryum silenes-dioicae]
MLFKPSLPLSVGLLWKNPWRMSQTRKMRARLRLKTVDHNIAVVEQASPSTLSLKAALALPTEASMPARDKYTTFSRTERGYRKSMHKVPKWTKLTNRTNPLGF